MENEIIINWVTYLVTYTKKEEKKQNERANGIWFIDTNGDIHLDKDEATDKHKPFCYPTEADCINARDKILAIYRIKEYCNEQWGEFIPDWSNDSQEKYFIYYCTYNKKYEIDYEYHKYETNKMYLAKQSHYVEIIEKFKDDLDILFDIKWK